MRKDLFWDMILECFFRGFLELVWVCGKQKIVKNFFLFYGEYMQSRVKDMILIIYNFNI